MSGERIRLRDLRKQALFGFVDGINGAVGLVIGLLHSHAAAALIFVALLARAGSSAVSMAGAEFESGEDPDAGSRVRAGRVTAMGLGYLTSALAPGLGFAFGVRPGLIVFIPAAAAVLAVITWSRSRQAGWPKATATTLIIFLLAVGAGLLASLAG